MINLKKIENYDIYSFEVSDDISEKEMHEFMELLETKASDNKIKLLGIFKEFPGFENFKAFNETMKLKSKALNTIEKYAILTDKSWVEALLPIGNMLTPNIPMKSFKLDERTEAIEWLDDDLNNTVTAREHLTNMEIEKVPGTHIYRFVIDERVDEPGVEALYEIFENEKKDEIRLMAVLKNFKSYSDINVLLSGIKADFSALNKITKYAILTDKKWVANIAEMEGKIFENIDVKAFPLDKEHEAMDWLKE